jgi:hypothetical protein
LFQLQLLLVVAVAPVMLAVQQLTMVLLVAQAVAAFN